MHNKIVQSLENAIGIIAYNMTNDFMFRYILQKNQKVLKGLICSLLHLKPHEIKSITIINPINLSENVTGKDFILDINIELNNNAYINLEMQVLNKHNWTDRSLSYLCRTFDRLYRGQGYEEARCAYHIGFLDFTLFLDAPEFYATNKMMNVKNHYIYSDKFVLSVVDLSHIELATEEDKASGLVYWARLFKAKTWEELKMLAKENEYLQEAAQSIYLANADEIVQQQCRAREEAERYERTMLKNIQMLKEENTELKADNAELKADNAELKADNAELKADNAELKANISTMTTQLQNMEQHMKNLESIIQNLQKHLTTESK